MQPKWRTTARVSQQRWEESYKLESLGEYFQTIRQTHTLPITFHLPYLAFHSKGEELESQMQK